MSEIERAELLHGFATQKKKKRGARFRQWEGRIRATGRRAFPEGGSMFAKIAICFVACALVLAVGRLGGKDDEAAASAALSSGVETVGEVESTPSDEMPGRLKFVELPSVLEVFAESDLFPLPIDAGACALEDDATRLALVSNCEQAVSACVDGKIKETGVKEGEGAYVILSAGDDTEVTYSGLESISVEEGQLVSEGDDLGRIESQAELSISVKVAGEPVDPSTCFRHTGKI